MKDKKYVMLAIKDLRETVDKVLTLIKSGEIANKNNLNVTIYLSRLDTYAKIACGYLESSLRDIY